MKKLINIALYLVLGTVLLLGLLYVMQPLFGFNITAAELLGHTLPYLKSKQPFMSQTDFVVKPYVKGLDKPRFMHVTQTGDLLVTEPNKGRLYLIPYQQPQAKKLLLSGLNKPHSMDIHEGYLYVAEEDAIGRIPFNALNKAVTGTYQRVITDLPHDGGHWTRTLKFGPDGFGYVSIGSSCNACIEKSPFRASISRFKPGDDHLTIFAKGLRNSVGFDWDEQGQLYATENGRDFLGDTLPPEELNLIEENHFYGWPYAYGNNIADSQFGPGNERIIAQSQPPVFEFAAHQAPLGLTFIKNPKSPLYKKALVALHGSWNSSVKVGYKVVSLTFDKGTISQEDVLTGFYNDRKVLGRPVHVVEGIAGELYLSDDFNGTIYLIEAAIP